jgi:HSP20 family protein
VAGKRRRSPFDDDFFGEGLFGTDMLDIERMMRRLMRGFESGELKEGNPIVYGFNMTLGPEGKPVVQEFGNVKPTMKGAAVSDRREPLIDVIEREEDITVIAELPGVEKHNVKLNVEGDSLTISAEGADQKYFKKVKLPAPVLSGGAKATCKNGVLEVVMNKREKSKPAGEQIKVE